MNGVALAGSIAWIIGCAILLAGLGWRVWHIRKSWAARRASNPVYQIILWTELWVVAAAVFAGMIWTLALIAAPLAALAYALLRLVIEKRLPGPTPAGLAILLFALILPVNYALAAVPSLTLQPILRTLGGMALYYAAVHWGKTSARLRWLAVLTGFASIGLCLFSLISVNWTSGKLFFIPSSMYERFSVSVGDAIHPNVLAGSLIALLPLALAMPLFAWRSLTWAERLLYPIVLISAIAAMLLTQSRGALVSLFVALLSVLLLRSAWFWLMPLAGLLSGIGVWFSLGRGEILMRLSSMISIEGLGQREDIWWRAIYMLQDFPLTGVGMGHFPAAFRVFYPLSLDPTGEMQHAHNLFLQVGTDMGIPGLVFWLGILIGVIAAAWQVYRAGRKLRQPVYRAIGAGLLACQLAFIFHGLFDSVLWGEIRIAPLVWWLWGLAMAGWNVINQPEMAGTTVSMPQGSGAQASTE